MNGKKTTIIIIGNEILSGKVVDENAPYLACELHALGVAVERIITIQDDVDTIAETVRISRKRSELIFVCGGIGPTFDDVTMQGIALGVERPLIQDPKLLELLRKTYGEVLNNAHKKMADVPEGTDLIFTKTLRIPVLHFEEIYIFPGIPSLVVKKFEAIKERFRESPFYVKKIYLTQKEESIAADLTHTLTHFPSLGLGSYPILYESPYKTLLTLESKEKTYLEDALKHLMDLLPENAMVQLEDNLGEQM